MRFPHTRALWCGALVLLFLPAAARAAHLGVDTGITPSTACGGDEVKFMMLVSNASEEARRVYMSATIDAGGATYGPYTIVRTIPADQNVTRITPIVLPATAYGGPFSISVTVNDDLGEAIDTSTLSVCQGGSRSGNVQEMVA